MQIDSSLVAHLANLSRLYFTEEEMVTMQRDLVKMTDFVEKLNELDTKGVEPLRHMSEVENVYRNDEVKAILSQQEALANAPESGASFFSVPKVLS
ncbi:MAG: Asp-tRNA(Asn)/Glu-tRNA(Gln) amidotransferase subunit GatC [Chitinophagaceae bacterium]|jgi:aspartyl-tRNA(Asn)/glutamyl-tRNA(Gln) amidotransferase subunit C|nr:Asp-tRNA(Asn)/Glu-tRNA(Gln) amidotransferase subunit GatC [Chitinophagaceae bacterium]